MPTANQSFYVRLPGLDDTYHLVPDSALPEDERKAKAQLRAMRLAASPTPEIVRGAQDVLTRIDDVQDGLVTLALVTRFAAARNPILAPIAKVMAVGADVLNIAQFMQTAGLIGAGHKGSMYRTLAASPRTYSQRLKQTLKTGAVNPTWGEALQVLQTTDQLFGVGLSLGAVIGAPIDAAFLALRGGTLEIPTETLLEFATLAPSFFAASPWVKALSLGAGFALSLLNTEKLPSLTIPIPGIIPAIEDYIGTFQSDTPTVSSFDALQTAEWIMETTPLLDMLEQDLSIEDHFAITMARYMAIATLAPLTMAHKDGALLREKLPLPVRARFPAAPSTREALTLTLGIKSVAPALALPGSPIELTAGELPDALRGAHAAGPLAWTLREPYHPMSIYAASLAGEACNALALMLEGPGSITRPVFIPEAHQAAIAIELGIPRDRGTPPG